MPEASGVFAFPSKGCFLWVFPSEEVVNLRRKQPKFGLASGRRKQFERIDAGFSSMAVPGRGEVKEVPGICLLDF